MTKKVILFTLAISAILVVWTQLNSQTPEERFNTFDTNKDGILSGDEMGAAPILSQLDLNADGTLTKPEAAKALKQWQQNKRSTTQQASTPAPELESELASLKEQPELLKPSEHGIGHLITHPSIQAISGDKPVVLILFSATCPITNKFGPEIARIEADFASQNVVIRLVNTVTNESVEDINQFIKTYQLRSPVLNDPDQSLLGQLRATSTTETFIIDRAKTLVYRGALNDQYGLGYTKPQPQNSYLRNALTAVLKNEIPAVAATTAPGCALDLSSLKIAQTDISYHHQVARLMQNHCVECHRKDGLAPFPLETMADVIDHAGMIRKQVERGAMPPWFAAHPSPGTPSPWRNDRSLPEADKATLLQWLASDRPAGDPALAPVARTFTSEWNIGTPDSILQLPKPIAIQAEGFMSYQTVEIPTNFAEDRWVTSYEVQPTAPSVVHHVVIRIRSKGKEKSEENWGAYVPGNVYRIYPEGFAKKLNAGDTLSFQIHYTPNGKATEDQMKIGLKFASKPPKYEIRSASVAERHLNIPPGVANHLITKNQQVPSDMMITSFTAHMHVRGAAFKYDITYPDQRKETLLDIPRYDFNWQLTYNYNTPKFIPKDSIMTITAVYDNSANNPANPDPTQTVRWGDQTHDEMMLGFVEHYVPISQVTSAQR